MKKVQEYCTSCEKITTHRRKTTCSKKKSGGQGESFAFDVKPLKCMTCGYIASRKAIYIQSKRHVKV